MGLRYVLFLLILVGCNSERPTTTKQTSIAPLDREGAPAAGNDDKAASLEASEQPDFFGQSWTIRGEVTDKNGISVEEFEASAIWSSNGVYWNLDGDIPEEETLNICKLKGVLAVRPQYSATMISKGTFELTIRDRPRAHVYVVNLQRTHGGIALVDRLTVDRPVRIELAPLVRVTAELICPESGKAPKFAQARIYVVGGDNMCLTQCGTWQGRVSFLLPPGEYEVDADGEFPTAAMRRQKKPDGMPLYGKYARGMRFTVPTNTTTLDLGVLELQLSKDSSGNAVDITQFYGNRPPQLNVRDVIGDSKQITLDDLRGK